MFNYLKYAVDVKLLVQENQNIASIKYSNADHRESMDFKTALISRITEIHER